MSGYVMGLVLRHYPGPGPEKLLATVLADFGHDDGTHIFPFVATLAERTSQSERTVQRQLERMRQGGWLVRVDEGHGGRSRAPRYRIAPEWLAACAGAKAGSVPFPNEGQSDAKKGDKLTPFSVDNPAPKGDNLSPFSAERVTTATEKGDTAVSPAKEPSEPNTQIHPPTPQGAGPAVEPAGQGPRGGAAPAGQVGGLEGQGEGAPLLTLPDFLARCEALGLRPVPVQHPVHEWAAKVGVPPEWLALAWAEWCHQRSTVQRRRRDWPDAFHRELRRGDLRLWGPVKGGAGMQLTTAGRQAQAFHGAVPMLLALADRPAVAVPSLPPVVDPELERIKAEAQALRDPAVKARNDAARQAAMQRVRQQLGGKAAGSGEGTGHGAH